MQLEELVGLWLDPKSVWDSTLASHLYSALSNSENIEPFRRLLSGGIPDMDRNPSFYINEFGWKMRPFLPEIVGLLDHRSPQVRFDAIRCLQQCGTLEDKGLFGRLLKCLDDPHPFVHRAVLMFIQQAPRCHLAQSVKEAAQGAGDTAFAEFPRCLSYTSIITERMIRRLISHKDPIARRFGVGLAVRPRLVIDDAFLELADACEDEEGRLMIEFTRTKWLAKRCVRGRVVDCRR